MTATELDPWLVYVRVRGALEAGTVLRAMPDSLLGGPLSPGAIRHQHFRIEPRGWGAPGGKCRPGTEAFITETLAVHIHHDLDPSAQEASYQLASRNFVAAVRALLTRTELSGLGQPIGGPTTIRAVRDYIHTELQLRVQYHVTLPEAV